MNDFRSSLTAVAEPPSLNQRATIGKSSPGGEDTGEGELNSRERSERHFLCCSFVGELNHRGRQSALIEVGRTPCPALPPCPSRTFENSQQHARVIYGWVRGPQQTQSPAGTAETLLRFAGINNRSGGPEPSLFHSFQNSASRHVWPAPLRFKTLPAKSKPVGRVN
jgi:hypothetical protein